MDLAKILLRIFLSHGKLLIIELNKPNEIKGFNPSESRDNS